MKFNFFKSKSRNKKEADTLSDNLDELDELGFTKRELMEYDKNIEFYYTNLINSLILFTSTLAFFDILSKSSFGTIFKLTNASKLANSISKKVL